MPEMKRHDRAGPRLCNSRPDGVQWGGSFRRRGLAFLLAVAAQPLGIDGPLQISAAWEGARRAGVCVRFGGPCSPFRNICLLNRDIQLRQLSCFKDV
ncbi:hypothetical protein SKAU_G00220640 [Synaphobranchus kaupii]|uniref:Uncharacterized protein n=1 Tax=Synaphobranchus kaupii TaxID=118154 RepID=A0A9Q1IUY8_SYNKA|nr:hypothetical protein SKAU_G00220640 [Synaphobranchus kaupii]